jgi:endo-1,4-beta-xylanase
LVGQGSLGEARDLDGGTMVVSTSRRSLLTALAGLPFGLAMATTTSAEQFLPVTPRPEPASLPARRFGAAVRPEQLVGDSALLATLRRNCQLLVPEYHGQWSAVEWRRGDPWYGNYDAIAAFAQAHDMTVRGHALIWEQMTPDWARHEMADQEDWRTIERHFATLLPRYRGTIGEWVVVNEMIDTEGGDRDFRRNSFQHAYGNNYVQRALETAHALDPDARLMINDFSLYHDNPVDEARRGAMLRLVERLKANGTPLHAVGLQGHIELAKGRIAQPRLARFLAELAGMGVDLAITELDVLEDDRKLPVEERDRRVADATTALLDVAMDQPAMRSVVTWGLSDRDSWLQDRAGATKAAQTCSPVDCGGLNRGLPFDGAFEPKPMYAALRSALALA